MVPLAEVSAGVIGIAVERDREADALALLQASADSMLDPHVLVEAVRGPDGRVVDFRYRSVNHAACAYLGLAANDLVGRTQLEFSPKLEGSELHRRYIQCLEDGQPLVLNDCPFFNGIPGDARRHDLRANRAGADLLAVTWRDVTDRFEAAQRIADAELEYRLIAENSSDVVLHGRDGRVVWVFEICMSGWNFGCLTTRCASNSPTMVCLLSRTWTSHQFECRM